MCPKTLLIPDKHDDVPDYSKESIGRDPGTRSINFIPRLFSKLSEFQIVEELQALGRIAGPVFLTSLLLYSKSIISMLFMGHLGDAELAGGSLAIGFANITGYSVLKGLSMGMEPICNQAYGAKKWEIIRQTFKRTLGLLFLAALPITFLWLNMKPLLLWLGQDEQITSVAQSYIKYSILDLIAHAYLTPLRIFLRTQNRNQPITVCAVCAMILHIPISYLLVVRLDLGIRGIALASAWNTMNINLGLMLYLITSRTALKPWGEKINDACLHGWRSLVALAMPSLLSVCLEWWWYEILVVLCGLLRHPQASLSAMGILIQMTGLLYVFPYSLSSSLSTRVGHELGAGQPARAKRTAMIGLSMAFFWGFFAFGLTTALRNIWGKLYASDNEILGLISIALPIVGLCELGNCPQTAACGVLVGSARPKLGAYINFGAFYLIGLPTAYVLSFKLKKGFLGLWFGLVAAQASCMCLMILTLARTDWDSEAERAKELTQTNELEENFVC